MRGTVQQTDEHGNTEDNVAFDGVTPTFGGLAVMTEQPRQYEFVAKTDVKVCVLSRHALRQLFSTHPSAEDTVLTAVLNKYNFSAQRDYSSHTIDQLVELISVNLDALSGAPKTIATENRLFAVTELKNRELVRK